MQPRREGHSYIDTIHTYYKGCNTADFDLMMSTFSDDVVHYFVDHSAVKGAEDLANYWCKVGPRTNANWALDHAVVQEPEAVIEWSMRWAASLLQVVVPYRPATCVGAHRPSGRNGGRSLPRCGRSPAPR